ncbi:hypothetical protein LCGC14_3063630, partial [marine sediment metagenome]
ILGDSSSVSVLTLSGGNVTVTGTIEGATLTEGGNAVPNATDHLGFFSSTTSAQLYGVISDETGTGLLVFSATPTLNSATFTGRVDMSTVSSLAMPNSAAPSTTATAEIALDTTITDHQPLWQYYDGGENMTVISIDTSQLPAQDNEVIKYDAASDKFVLEADADSGGATAWNNIGDPTATATIAFGGYEQVISSTLDAAGKTVLTIDHTDADVANNTTIFQINAVDKLDGSLTYIKIIEDSAATPTTVFSLGQTIANFGQDDKAVSVRLHDAATFIMYSNSDADFISMQHTGSNIELDGAFRVVGNLNLGESTAGYAFTVNDAGTAVFKDDGNDTLVTFGPVQDGTTILDIT